jgi:phage-related baseplate assembly protein
MNFTPERRWSCGGCLGEQPAPAEVTVAVLSREGDGTASDDLLLAVSTALNDETYARSVTA